VVRTPIRKHCKQKYKFSEERLNNKKENLLEKELVYEEVFNLAEKLLFLSFRWQKVYFGDS
jgi:hypothetical protein